LADQTLGAIAPTGTRVSTFGTSANLATVMVALAQPPSLLYLHEDQLGSVRMLTDTAGVVRGTFTYSPYGAQSASTGTSTTPFGFAGQYRDAETGFYYLQARYYDPSLGQFLSVDPLVEETQMPYTYVDGDPINEIDPSGAACGIWGANTCFGDAMSWLNQTLTGIISPPVSGAPISISCNTAGAAAQTVGAGSGDQFVPGWLDAIVGVTGGGAAAASGAPMMWSGLSDIAALSAEEAPDALPAGGSSEAVFAVLAATSTLAFGALLVAGGFTAAWWGISQVT
jgi:RHS repeat-associated protein